MSETETLRTAEQLSSDLKNRAYDCGKDESIDNPSQARLDRHEAALRKAEKDVVERVTTLERELAAMTAHRNDAEFRVSEHRRTLKAVYAELDATAAAKELAERQVAVLAGRLGDETHQLECPRSKDCNAFKTCADCWAAWARAEAEGGKG